MKDIITIGKNTHTLYYKEDYTNATPLIVFLCGTLCDKDEQAELCGFIDLTTNQNYYLLCVDYDTNKSYSEVNTVIKAVDEVKNNYSVDATRIYIAGYSQGGAVAMALTSEKSEYFAGIGMMGYMEDLTRKNQETLMPFVLVQGTQEFTRYEDKLHKFMKEEEKALHSLMVYNALIDEKEKPDYKETPYIGYKEDKKTSTFIKKQKWSMHSYCHKDYKNPIGTIILIDKAQHDEHRAYAKWIMKSLRCFKRVDKKIEEI